MWERFKRYLLRELIREQVQQGYDHFERIEGLYALIREEARAEFYEDNDVTLDSFLRERFEYAQYQATLK